MAQDSMTFDFPMRYFKSGATVHVIDASNSVEIVTWRSNTLMKVPKGAKIARIEIHVERE